MHLIPRTQVLPILLFGAMAGCGGGDETAGGANPVSLHASTAPTSTVATKVSLTTEQAATVCKAGIAKLFGQPAVTIKVDKQANGLIHVSYRRKSDGTLWKNDCKLEGNRIMWRAVDVSPGSGPGRWRDDPADGVLTYKLDGGTVEVIESL